MDYAPGCVPGINSVFGCKDLPAFTVRQSIILKNHDILPEAKAEIIYSLVTPLLLEQHLNYLVDGEIFVRRSC